MERYPDRMAFAHALVRLLAAVPDDRVRDGPGAMKVMDDLLRKEQRSTDLDEMMAMTLAALERYDEAVRWQRQAIAAAEQAGRGDIVKRLAATLSLYEHHKPCRTPWIEENQIYDLRSTIF